MERPKISDFTIPVLIFFDALISILAAKFAFEVGLDPDQVWGRTRWVLLTLGIILLLTSQFILIPMFRKVNPIWLILKSEAVKTAILIFHVWAAVFLIYAWFATYGTFIKWDHTTNYYSQLADAFNAGHLDLDVKPSEEILAMPDPYDPGNRPNQETIWDMSLYKGKVYLYWGPMPALLIAPLQLLLNLKISDIYIDVFFYSALLIVNSMILLKLRNDHFPNISIWNLFVCISLIGLISPVLWALIPTTIYGTAIGAAHFFFMGGIYFVLTAFDRKPFMNSKRLFLAGLFWACSVGSRAINTFSIIFLVALTMIWIFKITPKPVRWMMCLETITPLLIPLVFGAVALGWYNWARFGSSLEFGLRYQLGYQNLNKFLNLTFQPDYFPLNLYVYLLQPFKLMPEFPFTIPLYTPVIMAEHNIAFPKMFFAGRMTGLLFGAPFLLLGLVPFFVKRHMVIAGKVDERNLMYDFVIYSLAGSFLIGFLGLTFYFFPQMRYVVDVISPATILAIIGYWILISIEQKTNSNSSRLFVIASNFLVLLTLCVSLLLGVTGETSRMEKLNPVFLERIANSLSFEK